MPWVARTLDKMEEKHRKRSSGLGGVQVLWVTRTLKDMEKKDEWESPVGKEGISALGTQNSTRPLSGKVQSKNKVGVLWVARTLRPKG